VRNLLSVCLAARDLSESVRVRTLAEGVLGTGAFVVRAILFDKTPDANWSVPYHQDSTIAARTRLDIAGFGPWSVKDGVPHVRPPASILERMVTVRLHIDACGESNGPLAFLPGSHAHGFLGDAEIARWKTAARPVVCTVEAGDAVLMRPLVLHASPKAANPAHRRVIHLEYAIDPLPQGLVWASP
jgi:ectoine hydroxylase-related dioxygenase (phytanoyl-CoA dioxygenase family)